MIGTDIVIATIVGTGGTPLNNNSVLVCVDCVLNFTTGADTT